MATSSESGPDTTIFQCVTKMCINKKDQKYHSNNIKAVIIETLTAFGRQLYPEQFIIIYNYYNYIIILIEGQMSSILTVKIE